MLTPITLELGGKSPVFIDKGLSEDMMNAAVREILETKVHKTGQFCCSHDYGLVHEAVYEDFCGRLKAQIVALGPRRHVPMIGRRQYADIKSKLDEAGAECVPPLGGESVPNDE
ncbi:unnamed protein product, partial [Polarella glacialis]